MRRTRARGIPTLISRQTQPTHHLHCSGSFRELPALHQVSQPVGFPCVDYKGPRGMCKQALRLGLGKAGAHVAKEEQACAEGSSGLASFFQPQPRGTGSKNRPSGLHARPATPPMTSFFSSGSNLARALQRQGRQGLQGLRES